MYLSARLRGAFWPDIVHLALEGSAAQRPAWPRVQTLRFRFMFDVSFSRLCVICPPIRLICCRRACAGGGWLLARLILDSLLVYLQVSLCGGPW